MAGTQCWICFECAQTVNTNEAFRECTFCQVRFCSACQTKHLQSHSQYLIILRKVPLHGGVNSVQRCVSCDEVRRLRYSCQTCNYAKCLECWRILGINRHEHRIFNLYEIRENYERRRPPLPPRFQSIPAITNTYISETEPRKPPLPNRSQSTPTNTGARSATFVEPPLREVQTQAVDSMPLTGQPLSPQRKRHSLSRGFKKAYALSQKNTFTKTATGIALGTVGAALGADLGGVVDGLDALGFGDNVTGGGTDGSDAPTSNNFSAGDQGFNDKGTAANDNQDFSNLQNGSAETTEWMQQQYWQNVQLPYLAGPTLTPAMLNPTI